MIDHLGSAPGKDARQPGAFRGVLGTAVGRPLPQGRPFAMAFLIRPFREPDSLAEILLLGRGRQAHGGPVSAGGLPQAAGEGRCHPST